MAVSAYLRRNVIVTVSDSRTRKIRTKTLNQKFTNDIEVWIDHT